MKLVAHLMTSIHDHLECGKCKQIILEEERYYHVTFFGTDLCFDCYNEWKEVESERKPKSIREFTYIWKMWIAGKTANQVKVMLI